MNTQSSATHTPIHTLLNPFILIALIFHDFAITTTFRLLHFYFCCKLFRIYFYYRSYVLIFCSYKIDWQKIFLSPKNHFYRLQCLKGSNYSYNIFMWTEKKFKLRKDCFNRGIKSKLKHNFGRWRCTVIEVLVFT